MYSWYTISCSLSSIATWSTRTCISTFCFFWFYFHVSDYRECSRLPCTIQHVLTDYLLYEIKWFCVNPNLLISSSSFFFFCITRLWKNSLKPRTVQKLCVLGLEEALIPARLLKSHSNSMPLSTGEHESNQIKPHVWDHFHSHPPHIPCGSIALTLWSYMNVTPSMQIKACTSYCKNDKLRKVYQKWEVNYLLVYEVLHNILGL